VQGGIVCMLFYLEVEGCHYNNYYYKLFLLYHALVLISAITIPVYYTSIA